jgi:hypothetical protein
VGPFANHIPQAYDTLDTALPDVIFNGIQRRHIPMYIADYGYSLHAGFTFLYNSLFLQ